MVVCVHLGNFSGRHICIIIIPNRAGLTGGCIEQLSLGSCVEVRERAGAVLADSLEMMSFWQGYTELSWIGSLGGLQSRVCITIFLTIVDSVFCPGLLKSTRSG